MDRCMHANMKGWSCWALPVSSMQAVEYGILELPVGCVQVREHEVLDQPAGYMQASKHEVVELWGAANWLHASS